MNTVTSSTESNALLPEVPAAAPIPADRINELYRGEIFTDESAQIARDRIHWMCSQVDGDRVLDVGCSQGITAILLAREGCSVTAIDTHPESMAFAREELSRETPLVQGRLRLIETDLASLAEEPSFDTIVMGEVLEHQALPERFLRAGVARLRPGGRLVITTPFALHPHPDHKISVFPSHIESLAARLGLAVLHLDVEDHYIRAVLQRPGERAAPAAGTDLLGLTERATLRSQQRLYGILDDRREQLKKKTDALKVAQRKLNDAGASVTQAEASAARHAQQLREAQKEQAQQSRKLAELQAELQTAVQAAADAAARAQVQARAAQRQAGDKQLHKLEAEMEAARVAYEREQEQLKSRNAQLKERLGALKEQMRATKATTSYRLGRVLVRGLRSPRGVVGLPGELWSLGREVLARRRRRDHLASEFDLPTPAAGGAPAARLGAPAAHSRDDLGTEALKARLERDGLPALQSYLVAAARHGAPQVVALRALQLGKVLSESSPDSGSGFELAETALSIDRSDQTLRGYFWAAQRARRFPEACRTIRELEALYGNAPNATQQALLDKLRISPSYQLSALELVVEGRAPAFERVPRRIAYVLHNSLPYSSGGYGTRSHGVAGGIRDARYEVVVLTRPGFPLDIKPELSAADVPAEDVIDGIRYVRTLEPVRKGLSMLRYVTEAADALEGRLRELRPELVVAASNHVTALPALIAARRLGLPFVYEVRGLWEITRISREQEFEDTPAFAVQSLLEANVAQLADHVFTLTEPMREELSRRGVAKEKIDLLPNSCSPERFLPRERDQELAARLGIPRDTPVIGYIGTFVDYEGLDDLAVACTLLKRRGVNFRLMLVGNENASGTDRGPITEKILQTSRDGGMEDWLIMPGRVPHEEVESYYSLIDVAPFPRKPWPVCEMVSPLKPLEALAMEKAVVVSSVRALTDMITDGQTGRVFEKGRIESLVECLQSLLDSPAARAALGRQGRKWVCAERTWTQVGRLFSAHYSDISSVR